MHPHLITVCIFPSTKHTTEKASPHGTVPGNDWRWKPVGRRFLNRVSVWLIDTPEIQLPCLGNGCRYRADAPQRVWNARSHIQGKRSSRFCLSVRDFQQFPYRRIRSAILALIRRVVEDLESRCLQIYTAAMSLERIRKGKYDSLLAHVIQSCQHFYWYLELAVSRVKAYRFHIWENCSSKLIHS